MDALVPVFIAVLLAEAGGKMQALAHAQARAGSSTGFTLGLILITGAILFAVAAAGGATLAAMMPPKARDLFFALSLLFAGIPMFWQGVGKAPARLAAGLIAAPRLAIQMASDAAPFIVLAASARTGQPVLAAVAALAAVLAQAHLPLVFREDWPMGLPLRWIRLVAAVLITLAGAMAAINALGIG